ncbi:MAG: YeeE/YedE thiosulfate transporter family protein [Acetobacteraceae bacterium]
MGWGGIVAGGCNVSAYVSGIASGSLHGWVWIAAALPGNWLVVALERRLSAA